jgi:hypothetical protein
MKTLLRRTSLVALFTAAAARVSFAQTRTDVIRGSVKTDSGRVVAGADVYVTMAPDRITFHANSDSSGAYVVVVPNATGDYLVHISAIGRLAVRQRVTRVGAESTFVVDAILKSSVTQMAAVRVSASKQRPTRAADVPTSGGSADRVVDGVAGAIAPSDVGDVNAAAMTMPGALQAAGGFSMLGLPSSQNAVTVGGLAFPGADLPRDARTTTRFSTSTYDPSRGWFSGASANVDLITGSLFSSARGHLSADAPALPSGLPGGSSRVSNLQASYGADGPFTYLDRDFYSYGVQLSRRSVDSRSLINAPASLFDAIGLPSDSVARVLRALDALHVPLRGAEARVTETGSFIVHVDHAPVDLKTYTPAKTTFGITAYGKATRSSALTTSPTSTPGYGGAGSSEIASLQAFYSRFLTPDYLNETRSSLSVSRSRVQPYGDGPAGHVLLGAAASVNSAGSLLDVDFGGNGELASSSKSWTWEVQNETRFFAPSRAAHRLKISLDARFDGYDRTASPGTTGSFTYASLADLEANRPSAFTRAIGTDQSQGAEWNGYVAIGDFWRATPSLQLMYGARIEANRFLSTAARNADVEHAFGARTDVAPNAVAISPRLGFTWYRRPPMYSTHTTGMGTFNVGPSGYLRGGIGDFRNFTPANLLSSAIASSAPWSSAIRLTCLGAATPSADWGSPGANPSACAAGSSTFADTSRDVRFIDRSYRTPHSWRANLAYGSTIGRVAYTVEGIYSLNLDQPDSRDLNLRGASAFRTADEGREIFAPMSAIVPSTGAVAPAVTRADDRFGAVVATTSAARSISKQATLTLTPALPDNWFFSGSYTLGSIRARESGFRTSTFNNPSVASWNRGDLDVRHHFIASLGYTVGGFAISGQGHAMSGLPFTPIVGSDVNGDGQVNDRAFVFAPNGTADSRLAADLASLAKGSDRTARQCVLTVRGRAANQNECQGPWNFSLNAQASLSTAGLRARRVSSINLSIANPLAGLDAMLHGTPALRGWGSVNRPDPILYRVRGFDAANQRYQYEVNPAFGRTSTTRLASLNPFRLTLDVSFNLGRPLGEQQMDQWLKPGRDGNGGPKLSAADLKKRYARNVPDPYAQVLQEGDSLLLSREQVDRLTALRTPYRATIDSVITALSEHMASLGDKYDAAEALRYQESTLDAAWEITRQAVRLDFAAVLSPVQLTLLPGWAWTIYRAEKPLVGVRSFSFGPL